MRGIAVIGTDTGVGKTLVSAALMAAAGPDVVYWKPVQTGAAASGSPDDDTTTVRRLAGLGDERIVSPVYRYPVPASPHHAAALAGGTVVLDALTRACAAPPSPKTRWVVEGVGGLMVPLSERLLLPDLLRALGLPVLLVSSTRLGTINHTLLTLRQCEAEGLEVLGIVLNGPEDHAAGTGIAAHGGAPLIARVPTLPDVTQDALRGVGVRVLAHPAVGGHLR